MTKYIKVQDFNRIVKKIEHKMEEVGRIDQRVATNMHTQGRAMRKSAQNKLISSGAVFSGELLDSLQFRTISKTRRFLNFRFIANVPYSSWIEERMPHRKNVRVTRRIQEWYRLQQNSYGLQMSRKGGGSRKHIYVPRLGTVKVFRMKKHNYNGVHFMRNTMIEYKRTIMKTSVSAFLKDADMIFRKIKI